DIFVPHATTSARRLGLPDYRTTCGRRTLDSPATLPDAARSARSRRCNAERIESRCASFFPPLLRGESAYHFAGSIPRERVEGPEQRAIFFQLARAPRISPGH